MFNVRRLATRAEIGRRKVAADLAAQQYELPDVLVDELSPEVRRTRAAYLRALLRQARDDEESLWPGGYDMISRRQMEYVRKELRKLPGKDRPQDVTQAFLLLIGNIDRNSGEILLSRKEFADELGIAPRHVSSVMTTLQRIGVVRREYDRGTVTYFVDANVAWNGDLALRKAQAAKTAAPALKVVKGGAGEGP